MIRLLRSLILCVSLLSSSPTPLPLPPLPRSISHFSFVVTPKLVFTQKFDLGAITNVDSGGEALFA